MEPQELKSIISELIALSKVDGHVSDEEAALIKTMGNMLGMLDEDILALFENPAPFDPQRDPLDRIVQFHRMVLLVNIDGEPNAEELRHLKFMGMKLGLNPEAVDEVIGSMHNYPNNVIPPGDLLNIYKKYMN